MPVGPSPPELPSLEEARHTVEKHAGTVRPHGKELLDLVSCLGRVLAEPVVADRDFPPFRRAARDGYAVRAVDLVEVPTALRVIGEVKAGPSPEVADTIVRQGEAVSIMTGAPVPEGADSVVMVEHTSCDGDRVEISRRIAAGDNVVPIGSEGRRGDRLLKPGVQLTPASLGVAASTGRGHLLVYIRPRVAVLSTGDELVDVEGLPGPYQIRNSNSYSLAGQILEAGGEPVVLPIAPDRKGRLRELITEGLDADLLLLTGGVSMGKHDLVEEVLSDLKAEFFFTGALIQPGRPVVFGRVEHRERTDDGRSTQNLKYFFGLPGNPVSTMVTFELFVRPMIEALAGRLPRALTFLHAKLKSEIKTKTGLKRVLPALLSGEFEQTEVELVSWQGSGDLAAAARANCYIVVPPDRERTAVGEWVPVLIA